MLLPPEIEDMTATSRQPVTPSDGKETAVRDPQHGPLPPAVPRPRTHTPWRVEPCGYPMSLDRSQSDSLSCKRRHLWR